MHTQQIQYDLLIHIQTIPIFLSTHLVHMQQMRIYDPNAYAPDAIFPLYKPHAYAADVDLRCTVMLCRYGISLSTDLMHMRQIRLIY